MRLLSCFNRKNYSFYIDKQNRLLLLKLNLSMLLIDVIIYLLWVQIISLRITLKKIVSNIKYITNIVNIVNSCIDLGYWPSHFKKLLLIIIPKSNKSLYNILKTFYSIILLNMLEKANQESNK